jgi:hypothetical protein
MELLLVMGVYLLTTVVRDDMDVWIVISSEELVLVGVIYFFQNLIILLNKEGGLPGAC